MTSFKEMFKQEDGLAEETSAGDIAGFTKPLGLSRKDKNEECDGKGKGKHKDEDKEEELDESAVGMVGRTGYADADAYISAELRAEFKKIVKKLGGKTIARKLLAEMNPGSK